MEGMEIPIGKVILIMLSFLFTYGMGMLPGVLLVYFAYQLLGSSLLFFMLLPFLFGIGFYMCIIVVIGVIAFMVRLFRLEYKEGEYPLTLKDPQVFRYVMYGSFYHPINWLLTELHAYNFKELLIKAGGGKIGKGVVLGGFITGNYTGYHPR